MPPPRTGPPGNVDVQDGNQGRWLANEETPTTTAHSEATPPVTPPPPPSPLHAGVGVEGSTLQALADQAIASQDEHALHNLLESTSGRAGFRLFNKKLKKAQKAIANARLQLQPPTPTPYANSTPQAARPGAHGSPAGRDGAGGPGGAAGGGGTPAHAGAGGEHMRSAAAVPPGPVPTRDSPAGARTGVGMGAGAAAAAQAMPQGAAATGPEPAAWGPLPPFRVPPPPACRWPSWWSQQRWRRGRQWRQRRGRRWWWPWGRRWPRRRRRPRRPW